MDNNSFETSFEKGADFGGNTIANNDIDAWATAMNEAGDGPSYFGNTSEAGTGEANVQNNTEVINEYDQTISDGAAILNYGLNGASAMLGVDAVINGIKNFNVANSERPIHDLYASMGIDTKEEFTDLRQSQDATKDTRNAVYTSENAPSTLRRSPEGARKAIQDMQDLIRAVEKDDEDYAALREAAKKNNKSVFEQALAGSKQQDLASALSAISKEKSNALAAKHNATTNNSKEDAGEQDQDQEQDQEQKQEQEQAQNPEDLNNELKNDSIEKPDTYQTLF